MGIALLGRPSPAVSAQARPSVCVRCPRHESHLRGARTYTKTKGFWSPMLCLSFMKPVRAFSWSRVSPNMPTWTMQINCLCINFSLHPWGASTNRMNAQVAHVALRGGAARTGFRGRPRQDFDARAWRSPVCTGVKIPSDPRKCSRAAQPLRATSRIKCAARSRLAPSRERRRTSVHRTFHLKWQGQSSCVRHCHLK